ncbi:hypothetical protein GWK47_022986 [Chionoecetes opilio]|uniref:Uncharacterized protein n=1 Tax=Chionoecetes opilio TaxID=41210 RepID=A0A8J5CF15_CHIOP|nr:hypothetical protein GWK47_022986 [Chionoecetes opilio]
MRDAPAAHRIHQTPRESWSPGRGRRPGMLPATAYHPLDATQQQPRAEGALLQRVRLGYCTREELQEDFEGQECDHCGKYTRRPLVHYLLSYPATAPPRPVPAPAAQPADWGLRGAAKWARGQGRPHGPPHPERRDVGGVARKNTPSSLTHPPNPAAAAG